MSDQTQRNRDRRTMPDAAAHPRYDSHYHEHFTCEESGLSKRELFAAMAMQGFAANSDMIGLRIDVGRIARMSVEQADALIAALNASGEVSDDD